MGVVQRGFKRLKKLRESVAAVKIPSFRGAKRTRNLEIPGSMLRIAPE
jgi:hypothetical protein